MTGQLLSAFGRTQAIVGVTQVLCLQGDQQFRIGPDRRRCLEGSTVVAKAEPSRLAGAIGHSLSGGCLSS